MAEKKKFLLRIDSNIYAALERWAADDLRSINAEIEFLLTDSLKKSGRLNRDAKVPEKVNPESDTQNSNS